MAELFQTSAVAGEGRKTFAWWGAALLLLIIPCKALCWGAPAATMAIIDIAPSALGPAGLLFLLWSSNGRWSRWGLSRLTLAVGAIALGLEFAQLLPRPGLLAAVHYTFDPLDVAASLASLLIAYVAVRFFHRKASESRFADLQWRPEAH